MIKAIIFIYIVVACLYGTFNTILMVMIEKTNKRFGIPSVDNFIDLAKIGFKWFTMTRGEIRGRLFIIWLGFKGGLIWPYKVYKTIKGGV
jgi:hypothetical protein